MAINKGYLTSDSESSGDECYTPRYAVEPIVKHIQAMGYKKIWCPFDASHSFFVRVLLRDGFDVIRSHIDEGKDFFQYQPDDYDCIASNPPFSKKNSVLKRCFNLKKPFALLLPQNSLQSKSRVNLFIEHGLEYLGFDKRICFYTRGDMSAWKSGNHFASGYFCKNLLPSPLVFEKLTPIQEPYGDHQPHKIVNQQQSLFGEV